VEANVASHFSWVDFSEEDRRKMLGVIQMFAEHEARDEMGIGSIRDAFADHFFPGTSTIQTRARYFLFVPWVYRRLEDKGLGGEDAERAARKAEVKLIYALLDAGETEGVIGQDSKAKLQRLPSDVYWTGLRSWGILLFPGSRAQYHRSLNGYHRRKRDWVVGDDKEPVSGLPPQNWHPGLPLARKGFPDGAEMALTREEAEYLQERVLTLHPQTVMSKLLLSGTDVDCGFIWEHPVVSSLDAPLRSTVGHARNFSQVMHGASLLYNLLIARAFPNPHPDLDLVARYEGLLSGWVDAIESRMCELESWFRGRGSFWACPALGMARVPERTRFFVDSWLDQVFSGEPPASITSREATACLIRAREYMLKGEKARLHNQRALNNWSGAAGIDQLNFRWGNAKVLISDILAGLTGQTRQTGPKGGLGDA
jgi:hypothetical protein